MLRFRVSKRLLQKWWDLCSGEKRSYVSVRTIAFFFSFNVYCCRFIFLEADLMNEHVVIKVKIVDNDTIYTYLSE